jgi:transposase-like protein
MEEEVLKTKVCNHCKKEKPVTEFYVKKTAPDGLQYCCKECSKEISRENRGGVRQKHTTLTENGELAKYKPIELIAELRRRGYRGELEYVNHIKV